MSLDTTYRRLLLAYPARWRARRADEMLGTLMDAAEARGTDRPSLGEAADLVGNGLRERLTGLLPPGTPELIALLALASVTALSLVCFGFGEWWPWPVRHHDFGIAGPTFMTLGPLVYAGWAAVLLLTLARQSRVARLAGAATVTMALALPVAVPTRFEGAGRPPRPLLGMVAVLGVLAISAPIRHRKTLAWLTPAMTVLLGLAVWGGTAAGFDPRIGFYGSWGPIREIALNAAFGVLAVVCVGIGAVRSLPGLLPAALVVSLPWLAFALLLVQRDPADGVPYVLALLAGAACCAAVYAVVRSRTQDTVIR